MKLLFKQRYFSWFDSYDVYYEDGSVAYTVQGQLSWGHKIHINDSHGIHIATVKEKVFTWLPRFEFFVGGAYVGSLKKKFTFIHPSYEMDFKGWCATGNFIQRDYVITEASGATVASISKQILNFTDTYVIEVANPHDALYALLFTLAVDTEKCDQS